MSRSVLKHRITTLEQWGYRASRDYQADGLEYIRSAGYNTVLVNGGSGFGPDMISPEMIAQSDIIPDLMPYTIKSAAVEIQRRISATSNAGLKTWLCNWTIPGPQVGRGNNYNAQSPLYYDRRTKLEMTAKLRRTPLIFGSRNRDHHSWRGDHPLCLSNSIVKEYYQDLYTKIPKLYPEIDGVIFFPGDCEPEICDETCPRCSQSGLSSRQRLIEHVNHTFHAMRSVNPSIEWYFVLWSLSGYMNAGEGGFDAIKEIFSLLDPEIGIVMSMNDVVVRNFGEYKMTFEQPWMTLSDIGDFFHQTAAFAADQGRSIIGLHEFSQSEVFDPVCLNVPLPVKTYKSLKALESIQGITGILDFWGNHSPWLPHANHAIMAEYFTRTGTPDEDQLLQTACRKHYNLEQANDSLINKVLSCWKELDKVIDNWPFFLWGQRFSAGIGRNGSRGGMYCPLVPPLLKMIPDSWMYEKLKDKNLPGFVPAGENLVGFEQEFENIVTLFLSLGSNFADSGNKEGEVIAVREAHTLLLMSSLISTQGRTLLAFAAFEEKRYNDLREIIEKECLTRERQLDISGKLGFSGGVHPVYVSEDIQNMRLYLSCDDFPHTPAELFHFTFVPEGYID